MSLKWSIAGLFFVALISFANASISFSVAADRLNGTGGAGDPAPLGSLVALIADTNNDGVTAWAGNLSVGGFLDHSAISTPDTDLILALATLNANTLTAGVFFDWFPMLSPSGSWGTGDLLYLAWFPTYTIATTSLFAGAPYGLVALGATPSDGYTVNFEYLSTDASGLFGPGTMPATTANLQIQAVPEPSCLLALAGLGLVGWMRRRRR